MDDENDDNFIEATEKVMKKLRKIKYELIKTNLHMYSTDMQELSGGFNLPVSKYLIGNKKSNEKEKIKFDNFINKENENSITDTYIETNKNEDFIDVISKSSKFKTNNLNLNNNYSQSNHFNKFKHYPFKDLIYLSSISLGHSTKFNLEPYCNTKSLLKLNLITKYDLNLKRIFLFSKITASSSTPINGIEINSKFKINSLKRKINLNFYFKKYEKLPFLQKPFLKTQYRYSYKYKRSKNKNNFSLTIGNKYKDEACEVKTLFVIPKRNIKFYFHTYLKDAYNSIIGFHLTNLKKLIFFYSGYLNTDIEIASKFKILLNRSFKFTHSFIYRISDKFKLGIWSGLKFHSGQNYNVICLGFHFKSFVLRIPIVISKIDNSSSLKDIILANFIINGIAYSIHLFKKILF